MKTVVYVLRLIRISMLRAKKNNENKRACIGRNVNYDTKQQALPSPEAQTRAQKALDIFMTLNGGISKNSTV